jgi:hypothetical protein
LEGRYLQGQGQPRFGGLTHRKRASRFHVHQDSGFLTFAAYINFVPVAQPGEHASQAIGQALGEIAAAGYKDFR